MAERTPEGPAVEGTNPITSVAPDDVVVIGRIIGLLGLNGWVKVYAYTREKEAVLQYPAWFIRVKEQWRSYTLVDGRLQGGGVVASLEGCDHRDQAQALVGADIAIAVTQLPRLKPGEFYWTQLQGLKVQNLDGVDFGQVSHLFDTGANDVLVVQAAERQRLIPYISDVIKEVDFAKALIRVDWDADF